MSEPAKIARKVSYFYGIGVLLLALCPIAFKIAMSSVVCSGEVQEAAAITGAVLYGIGILLLCVGFFGVLILRFFLSLEGSKT